MKYGTKSAVGKKISHGKTGVGRRTLGRIYGKNTGLSQRTRNTRVKKHK